MKGFLLFLLVLAMPALSSVIEVPAQVHSLRLAEGLEYLHVRRDSHTLPDASESWEVSGGTLAFGFDKTPLWVRFELKNSAPQARHLVLEIANPLLDQVDVWTGTTEHRSLLASAGDQRPLNGQTLLAPNIAIPLDLAAGETLPVLLRIETSGSLNVPLAIMDVSHYTGQTTALIAFQVLLLGALLGIGIYQFMVFLQLRERGFLLYSLFILFSTLTLAGLQGLPQTYFGSTYRLYADTMILVSYALALMSALSFILTALSVRASRPRYAMAAQGLTFACATALCLISVLDYGFMIRLMTVLSSSTVIVVITIQVRRMLDHYEPAYYSGGATIFAGIGVILYIAGKSGWIEPSLLTHHAADIGILLMAVFYALALSQRIDREQKLRIQAQRATMNAQKQLLTTEKTLNKELDNLVQERTRDLEEANDKLRHMSLTDPLTGLSNRRHLDQQLENSLIQSRDTATPLSLMIADIDHFKQINDTYGHPFGDACLVEVARRIQAEIPETSSTAARLGGEEFVILLEGTPHEKALLTAEAIAAALRNTPVTSEGHETRLTASFGLITTIPESDTSGLDLINRADALLYRAKQNGRDRIETGPSQLENSHSVN